MSRKSDEVSGLVGEGQGPVRRSPCKHSIDIETRRLPNDMGRARPSAFARCALHRPTLLAAVIVSVLTATPALALESDRDQPMRIRSDRSESDLGKDSTVLIGNVRITQGTLEVNAERADITQAEGAVSRAVLTGSPATMKQQVDAGGELRAQARRIDYALASETVELSGGVIVERPQGTLKSERVTYSVKDGRVVAGDNAGGVELVIPPRAPKPKSE